MNRRLLTYVLLCTSLAVVIAAQFSFKKPAVWKWAQTPLATLPVSTEPRSNQVAESSKHARRAPYPILKTLEGAADLEPFLAPPENALPELQKAALASRDAEARYHLLQLAKDATPGALEADARENIRYRALVQKPNDYRGELIKITGDLISLAEPMELKRKIPGMEVCYLGLVATDQPEHQYLVLFPDLPPGLPEEKKWNQLYLRNVQASGYFYKVARFTRSEGKVKSWMLPVLVAKTIHLSETMEDGIDWFNLITIFLVMALPVVLIVLCLPRFFRAADAEHAALMERYRQQREERVKRELDGG
ncbi:MAG: hypothetical protein U0796_20450 [Gemmatales bacterium]